MNGRTNSTSTGAEFIEIPLDPVTNFSAIPGNGNIELKWTDPKNKYATDEGETAQDPDQLVSVWKYTKIVRKIGEYPQNPNDGVVVVESGVHNQYQTNPYVDTGLENDTTYYYCAYAINEDEVASEPAQVHTTSIVGIMLSTLSEGTLIKINENGSPVEFYIVAHDYESESNGTGRIAVLRKDGYNQYDMTSIHSSGGTLIPIYGSMDDSCPIIRALNTNYYNLFSSKVKTAIGNTTVTCHHKTNNYLSNSTRHIHIPSITEYKLTNSGLGYYPDIGTPWVIGDSIRICHVNGIAVEHWTRTINDSYCSYVDASGRGDWTYGTTSKYARPLFTLPETARVDINMELIEDLL